MKMSSIIVLMTIVASAWTQAMVTGHTYTTRSGNLFVQVNSVPFGMGWKAPNGDIWSTCQGQFFNKLGRFVPPQQNQMDGNIVGSDAANACLKISGILPSLQEYKSLYGYFNLMDLLLKYIL